MAKLLSCDMTLVTKTKNANDVKKSMMVSNNDDDDVTCPLNTNTAAAAVVDSGAVDSATSLHQERVYHVKDDADNLFHCVIKVYTCIVCVKYMRNSHTTKSMF
jgi:hypothetical protein